MFLEIRAQSRVLKLNLRDYNAISIVTDRRANANKSVTHKSTPLAILCVIWSVGPTQSAVAVTKGDWSGFLHFFHL